MSLKVYIFIIHYINYMVLTENLTIATDISEVSTLKQQYYWYKKELSGDNVMNKENITIHTRMATPCTTPNNDDGYCIEIQKCPQLLNQLSNSNALDFLRKSECGPKNQNPKTPKVCCGKYHNYKYLVEEEDEIFPKICGHQNITTENRIVGGSEAALGEFPWMARLIHRNRYDFVNFGCSGFLVHAKYVLTAAHCVNSDIIDSSIGPVFEVQLGEHDIETEIDCNFEFTVCADKPIEKRVLRTITHPKYVRNSRHHHFDIALIHLDSSVQLTRYIHPICLLQDWSFQAMEYWISGWGKTGNATISRKKQKLSIPHFSWENCVSKYKDIDVTVTRRQICAGGIKGKDGCTGDSGGPLMVLTPNNTWFAAGLISYGLECGREYWPGVYTNVTSYMDWIKSTIDAEESRETIDLFS